MKTSDCYQPFVTKDEQHDFSVEPDYLIEEWEKVRSHVEPKFVYLWQKLTKNASQFTSPIPLWEGLLTLALSKSGTEGSSFRLGILPHYQPLGRYLICLFRSHNPLPLGGWVNKGFS
ncbi:hypothetical protein [Limnofasciculus baicalensis]|uniref:Uncharacterized protein n=1 Tax=Limnofasciculus baicalensis BBK-W-15 TaxID=2699891 RepID=A0AAE3KLN4_9CYAN|nr:hypothetical protein [Limnofasciculus baicalensis]MCP2728279.1 hypothetical protein [Limnofasciculus baicalensis BBK-W-15]